MWKKYITKEKCGRNINCDLVTKVLLRKLERKNNTENLVNILQDTLNLILEIICNSGCQQYRESIRENNKGD